MRCSLESLTSSGQGHRSSASEAPEGQYRQGLKLGNSVRVYRLVVRGADRVTATSAARIDWTASNAASFSTEASGSRARMARYRDTLLITVPPRARMRAKTAGVTSARMSTVTSSSAR